MSPGAACDGRLLVTGATGFIGRQAVKNVSAGFETHILVREKTSVDVIDRATRELCHVHRVNLLDRAEVTRCIENLRPTHLLHLAWHPGTTHRWTSAANVDWAAATVTLVAQFAAHGGHRVVVCGSCAEYDWSSPRFIEDETPLNPRSAYGVSKAATHTLISSAAAEWGVSVGWAHVFFCYGPGEPSGRLVSDVISGVLNGQRVRCTAGMQVRDYLHCADVGRALAMLLASGFEGSMNVASGRGIAVRDLALAAADILGRRDLLDLGSKQMDATEPARIVADVTRLANTLKFEPAFTIERGLQDTIDWFRERSLRRNG